MITEAVILAGGFGTRLKHLLGNDIPKPMAPVYGKPFLCYVLDKLQDAGINRVVLATGYLHNKIEGYFGNRYREIEIRYSEEKQPLFTGGAILQATQFISGTDFFVINGDTLFDIDYQRLSITHTSRHYPITIALRQVDNAGRYGKVELNSDHNTKRSFHEKQDNADSGLINGGIYAINKQWLLSLSMPQKFSFETELLQTQVSKFNFGCVCFNTYFIDIGVPDDYHKAQQEFHRLFDKDDTLFLDRDGVINEQIIGDYVRSWEQFKFIDGALTWLKKASSKFKHIIIVSNQQGIGKGLFTNDDLELINAKMTETITNVGGRIDKAYYCTDLVSADSPYRKPQIGMALQAQCDFGDIDFSRSLMIGDSVSDMQFGYNAGMRCVYITKGSDVPAEVKNITDLYFPDLKSC